MNSNIIYAHSSLCLLYTSFIDPGHGGHDPGSQTKSRKEKDDTLRIALQIKKELNKKNFKVYLTPVSYTHLDVYKRQPHILRAFIERINKFFHGISP